MLSNHRPSILRRKLKPPSLNNVENGEKEYQEQQVRGLWRRWHAGRVPWLVDNKGAPPSDLDLTACRPVDLGQTYWQHKSERARETEERFRRSIYPDANSKQRDQ